MYICIYMYIQKETCRKIDVDAYKGRNIDIKFV